MDYDLHASSGSHQPHRASVDAPIMATACDRAYARLGVRDHRGSPLLRREFIVYASVILWPRITFRATQLLHIHQY